MEFKFLSISQIQALPVSVGVYAFFASSTCPPKLLRRRKLRRSEGGLFYIGKAINIKERVKNHFNQPTFKDNIFIPKTKKIGFIVTGSEIEALLLEAKLIKELQPKYNTVWRDGKSHNYVFITKEEFPRIFVGHLSPKISKRIGPFIDGQALKQTLRVLRRVFSFRTCRALPKKNCLYYDLRLCPAPCVNKITKTEYANNIKNLLKILQGKKPQVLRNLKKEMRQASQKQEFEKAKALRDQIFALENVFQHSHILEQAKTRGAQGSAIINWEKTEQKLKKLLNVKNKIKRMEGYDISNIQGQQATGSMVVFKNGLPNKNEYRKFKIKISGKPNDTAMLKEMIQRRLKHAEWPMPQVMLIDGGRAQLNAAIAALKSETLNPKSEKIKIISLAKRNNELFIEGKDKPILLKNLPQETANLILRIRDEAHRFAITYHKKLRSKSLLF